MFGVLLFFLLLLLLLLFGLRGFLIGQLLALLLLLLLELLALLILLLVEIVELLGVLLLELLVGGMSRGRRGTSGLRIGRGLRRRLLSRRAIVAPRSLRASWRTIIARGRLRAGRRTIGVGRGVVRNVGRRILRDAGRVAITVITFLIDLLKFGLASYKQRVVKRSGGGLI